MYVARGLAVSNCLVWGHNQFGLWTSPEGRPDVCRGIVLSGSHIESVGFALSLCCFQRCCSCYHLLRSNTVDVIVAVHDCESETVIRPMFYRDWRSLWKVWGCLFHRGVILWIQRISACRCVAWKELTTPDAR